MAGEQQMLPEADTEPAPEFPSQGEHILQFFAYSHYAPHLQAVAEPYAALASAIVSTLPRNPERTIALRHLLDSREAALRAKTAHA